MDFYWEHLLEVWKLAMYVCAKTLLLAFNMQMWIKETYFIDFFLVCGTKAQKIYDCNSTATKAAQYAGKKTNSGHINTDRHVSKQ